MYTDIQINGAFGVDFNDENICEDDLARADEQLREAGTSEYLATVITSSIDAMCQRASRIRSAMENGCMPGCLGIHLEGPFMSPEQGYIGAHPAQHAIPASVSDVQTLQDACGGFLRVLTLAPERDCGGKVTRYLTNSDVIVAAGHTNASIEQLQCCRDEGLNLITHFGNGCPATMLRHDNILWRMMACCRGLYLSVIVDGHHLPRWLLPVLIDYFGPNRIVVVSDAISAAGLGTGTFRLGHREVTIGEDRVARDPVNQHFVGSTALMSESNDLLIELGFDQASRQALLCDNARQLLAKKRLIANE